MKKVVEVFNFIQTAISVTGKRERVGGAKSVDEEHSCAKRPILGLFSGMKKEHIGSDFDDFLREENLLEIAEATAAKRAIAFQVAQEMKRCRLTKLELASRMKTSRPALERLLDLRLEDLLEWMR